MREFGLGRRVSRFEDRRFLTGRGRYTDDLPVENPTYAWFVRSPYAKARIRSIDTAAAVAMPGVLAILTGRDAEADGLGTLTTHVVRKRPDGGPMGAPPFRMLAFDRVARVGEAVAMVIAETRDAAKDAAEAVVVDYEVQTPVIDGVAAAAGRTAAWDDIPDNICFVFELGDKAATDAAFARADHVARVNLRINRIAANPMETRTALGHYDADADRYTLWASVQQPHMTRRQLATQTLRIPERKLRVIAPDIGGGFGIKGTGYTEPTLVLWASRRVGRPVKWIAERSETFLCDDHARDAVSSAELALDKKGKFLGFRVRTIANIGSYVAPFGPHVPTNNLGGLVGVYTIPTAHVAVTAVLTNTNSTAPYRGAGRPEATFVIERAIDKAALDLGIDRAELRRRNLIPADAFPYKTALVFTFDSGNFPAGLAKALELSDWGGFEARRAAATARGKLRGIGIAYGIEQSGAVVEEAAEIRIDADGAATLFTGSSPHGQGHETMYRQMAAEFLGLHPDLVRVVHSDTDQVFHGVGTFGSRSAAVGGAAMRLAAERIVTKGKSIAAHMLEAAEADIEFVDGRFGVAGTDRAVTLAEVARTAFNVMALPRSIEPGLTEKAVFAPSAPTFPNGCHVCEVEIDPETGAVAVVGYVVVDDVGRVVNPLMLEGQIHGGVAQGVGQILFENIAYDGDGQLLTGSFMDYAMPRAEDMPNFVVGNNSVPCATNPLGIKGAGEAGTVGALAATTGAIVDALRPYGVEHIEMPATPERVWRAIRGAGRGSTAA